ncbi:MAG TPA: ferritin-like domain-containing protein [Gemmatimonadaceae bacterium]|jgi:ferritin-like metal-binding protein YciE
MGLDNMKDLYLDQIGDLYSAETQIIEALPKMIETTSHAQLRDGFSKHLTQTREHARRLEAIGKRLGERIDDKKCKGMEGLLKEGSEAIKKGGNQSVVDAALIAAAQRVEHYEIAGYGCARTYADALGLTEDASDLQRTLDEEAETDKKLTQIAESIVNPDAQRTTRFDRDVTSQRFGEVERNRPDMR